MSIYNRILGIIISVLAGLLPLHAQNKRLITGNVIDAVTKEPLPFVTVSLKKQMIGIVTNEEGKFDLYIPQEVIADTLWVNYLGYKHFLIDIAQIKEPLLIKLEETVVQLEEIVIRPLMPENYIQMAMRKIKDNYPEHTFQTEAYYREKILENDSLLKSNEGVFKTFYNNYIDTGKTQNQLMLFRKADHPHPLTFMNRQRRQKEIKDSINKANGKESNVQIDIGDSFGGPAEILKSLRFKVDPEDFLDSAQFKSFKYSFAKSSTYNTSELVVIDFETRGKVNHVREKGRIYIDVNSHAIVKIERKGDFIIPAIVKPIFFFMSIGIKNPKYERKYEFQQIAGKWYPKNIESITSLKLTNNHLFRKDEKAIFTIEQFFVVNELKIENSLEIPPEKRFHSDKPMSSQVFNDNGLTWEGLNIIKK